jgi:thiamine-phosphate pyrophosphorylase
VSLPSTRPLLYLITDRRAHPPSPDGQLAAIREAAAAGCRLVQVRERDLGARDLAAFVRAAVAAARPGRVLVNDRLDVALAAGADGVHLRATSLPAAEARAVASRLGRPDFLIGVSTHALDEAREAEAGGADFVVAGPVFETPSKLPYGPPLGPDRFAEVCRAVRIPVLAIGGINLENFREPLSRGAAGVAAIGMLSDPRAVARTVRELLTQG